MKKLVLCLVLAIAIVSQVKADFSEDFESYADGTQLDAPTPWIAPATWIYPTNPPEYQAWPMETIQLNGYGDSMGAHPNGANWYDSRRDAGQTSATADLVLSAKARLSGTTNGLARLTWGFVGEDGTQIIYEYDAGGGSATQGALNCPIANAGIPVWTAVLLDRGVWYDIKSTIDQVAGTLTTEVGPVGGALAVVDGPKALPAGFVVDTIKIGGIWAWDEGDYVTSALDDVVFTTVPEPATMVLLSLGGLLLRRRR